MQNLWVLTIIGEDRPGLVESVAGIVTEHGGNWLESQMARLGGQFAGILRASIPTEREDGFLASCKDLGHRGIAIQAAKDKAAPVPQKRMAQLEIVGDDRPGIVREISRALAAKAVNVEEFHSGCESAAMSGFELFRAQARLSLPPGMAISDLRLALEKIAADLIVDLRLEEISKGATTSEVTSQVPANPKTE